MAKFIATEVASSRGFRHVTVLGAHVVDGEGSVLAAGARVGPTLAHHTARAHRRVQLRKLHASSVLISVLALNFRRFLLFAITA